MKNNLNHIIVAEDERKKASSLAAQGVKKGNNAISGVYVIKIGTKLPTSEKTKIEDFTSEKDRKRPSSRTRTRRPSTAQRRSLRLRVSWWRLGARGESSAVLDNENIKGDVPRLTAQDQG
eukprot:13203333-Heterocapsa_arctica.AAC.1